MSRLIPLVVLIAGGCGQQAELRGILTSGKWVKDLGSPIGQTEHYVYTFDRDGTYTSKLLTDHTTPIVEGRWRLVEGADGKIHLQLSEQQGKDRYYWLSQDSLLGYDRQKDELVVSGGHYDGAAAAAWGGGRTVDRAAEGDQSDTATHSSVRACRRYAAIHENLAATASHSLRCGLRGIDAPRLQAAARSAPTRD